jgi:hypothetical protein
MGRQRDGGGGGGRWNGVGRGRSGAGGRVRRRDYDGGRAEARIGRWGGEARGEVSARAFFTLASTDAARWSRSQILVPRIRQTGLRPKKTAAPRRMQRLLEEYFVIRRCISVVI